jgi:diaminopimelate decarboxylase
VQIALVPMTTGFWGCPPFNAEELVRSYGSPLFVFFPEILKQNIRRLQAALQDRYLNHVLAYSVKTNHLPYVVRRAVEFGTVPEIIPGLELGLVERLRLIDRNTIVNGPLKTEDELRRIVAHRCRLNVDNQTELKLLEKIAIDGGNNIDIGIRVASEFGNAPWTRFGFFATEITEIAQRMRVDMPHLRLVGLHIHGGTNITESSYYRQASALLCDIAKQLEKEGLLDLSYLDLGGGFATECAFKDQDEWNVPSAEEYVNAMVGPILDSFGEAVPTLIVEPGRYLIDNAVVLLTTVERLRGGERHEAIVDAGINIFPSARFRRHRVACLTQNSPPSETYSLFGPLCMRSDCLAERVQLPALEPGDILALDYAGAYSISQSWNFIRLQPAVVAFEGGAFVLVRRAETIDDFLVRDSV